MLEFKFVLDIQCYDDYNILEVVKGNVYQLCINLCFESRENWYDIRDYYIVFKGEGIDSYRKG